MTVFFVVRYDSREKSFVDTLRLPYNSKIQPLFKELDDNYLVLTIGLESLIISKIDLKNTFEPYKDIFSQYESEGYDTYDFEIEEIKIEGDSVECFLSGAVKDRSVKLLWGTKELNILE